MRAFRHRSSSTEFLVLILSSINIDFWFEMAHNPNTAPRFWGKAVKGEDGYLNDIFARDRAGNTLLHLHLSKGCFCKDCVEYGVQVIENLLAEAEKVQNGLGGCKNELQMANMLNGENKTALHYVVENMIPIDIVRVLVKYGASLTEDELLRDRIVPCFCSGNICRKHDTIQASDGIVYPKLAQQMIHKYPEVLEILFDHGVKFKKGAKSTNWSDMLELDLRRLIYSERMIESGAEGLFKSGAFSRWAWQETQFLHDISTYRNAETSNLLLNHPLTLTFEKHKRRLFSLWYHWAYMFIFAFYIAVFYGFITKLYFWECKWDSTGNVTEGTDNNDQVCRPSSEQTRACLIADDQFATMIALAFGTLILWLVPFFVELRKLRHFGWVEYRKLWQSYVTVLTMLSVFVSISPILFFNKCVQLNWEYSMGAISTLLCALSLMIHCNPLVSVTIYTEMLFKVLSEILKASAALVPLFIGFYLSFRMLGFQEDVNPFRLLSMVFADTDYEGIMTDGRGFAYIFVCYVVFIIFIILVLLVVINFLIGVAVSDVQELKTLAKLSALSNRLSSYYLMDCIYGGRGWHSLTAQPQYRNGSIGAYIHSAIYGGPTRHEDEAEEEEKRFFVTIYPLNSNMEIRSEKTKVEIPLKMRRSLVDLARKNCTGLVPSRSDVETARFY